MQRKRKKIRKMTRSLKSKTAVLAVAAMMVLSLAGCGKKEEEPYISPSFNNESDDNQKYDPTVENSSVTDATYGDAELMYDAEPSGQEMSEAVKASMSDPLEAGVYGEGIYYNSMANFAINVNETNWSFYDAEGVASATGLSVEDVDNFWYGYKTTQDAETSYCCIAYDNKTGSNIIVSYVNPSVTLFPEITAEDYLAMALNRYDNLLVKRIKFLGDTWACLDIPADQNPAGRRVCYAKKSGDILILVTFTMQDDQELSEAQELFSRLK